MTGVKRRPGGKVGTFVRCAVCLRVRSTAGPRLRRIETPSYSCRSKRDPFLRALEPVVKLEPGDLICSYHPITAIETPPGEAAKVDARTEPQGNGTSSAPHGGGRTP